MIRGWQSGKKSWCEGEKRWQDPKNCILDFKNLQGFWHAADRLIFQNRYIFFLSLFLVLKPMEALSPQILLLKKKSLHKTLPLIDLIHFPILPWEPDVFLLQSTNFPVSSLTCHLTSSKGWLPHLTLLLPGVVIFTKLTSAAFLQNYSEQCPLDIKGCSEFPCEI